MGKGKKCQKPGESQAGPYLYTPRRDCGYSEKHYDHFRSGQRQKSRVRLRSQMSGYWRELIRHTCYYTASTSEVKSAAVETD